MKTVRKQWEYALAPSQVIASNALSEVIGTLGDYQFGEPQGKKVITKSVEYIEIGL